MIKIPLEIYLDLDDQDKLQDMFIEEGDGLTFKQFCAKVLSQELRFTLDKWHERT